VWRGSARSIEGFDLAEALKECGDLIERGGGHAMAAGLSLRPENLGRLRERLSGLATKTLSSEQWIPQVRYDAELPLILAGDELVVELEKLEPTGMGNPAASFLFRGLRLARPARRMGRDQRHVRLRVARDGCEVDVVWWAADDAPLPEGVFDLVARPRWNEFNGTKTAELQLSDWRPATAG
jgi:single-stranded-DNA-specific exonuclease